MAHWWSIDWAARVQAAASVVLLLAFWWALNRIRYSARNLEKGIEAEERTGEVIEYALAQANCAAAHNVTDVTDTGDIDHLVATPQAVWVVDSKFRYNKRWLEDKVNEVEQQVHAVEQWVAQQGFRQTPVKGCLAFLTGFDEENDEQVAKGGTVVLCVDVSGKQNNGLVKALRETMKNQPIQTVDKDLIRQIWKLGAEESPTAEPSDR